VNANVAPVGVAESGTVTLVSFGSLLKRSSEPVTATAAVDDPGIVAETVSAPEEPAATVNVLGVTANANPVAVAVTVSGPEPVLSTWSVCVPTAPPHATAPNAIEAGEKRALGRPPLEGDGEPSGVPPSEPGPSGSEPSTDDAAPPSTVPTSLSSPEHPRRVSDAIAIPRQAEAPRARRSVLHNRVII
jgi:hypothetical protein